MTEFERGLREAIDAPLTESPWNGSHRVEQATARISGLRPGRPLLFAIADEGFPPVPTHVWVEDRLEPVPGPGRIETWRVRFFLWLARRRYEAPWLHAYVDPLTRFNRQARNVEFMAYFKTVGSMSLSSTAGLRDGERVRIGDQHITNLRLR